MSGVIVAGHLRLAPDERAAYLAACRPVIEAARAAPGCRDFHLSADPLEPDRINVVEVWESAEAVDVFRGTGPDGGQAVQIRGAEVHQYEVGAAVRL